MSNNLDLKKGLNIPIKGVAAPEVIKTVVPDIIAVKPTCFKGLVPRLLVKEGDAVKAGSPVMADKQRPEILLTSPVSGTVEQIVRGEKRKLLAVLVKADASQEYVDFGSKAPADAAGVKELLLNTGLWAALIQRPYGILANPAVTPKAIFVSAFNTTPGAADTDFAFEGEIAAIQAGIDALSKIAQVHVSFNAKTYANSPLARLNATKHFFEGKCPAGNVGVQISHISPIKKEETVWTISLQGLAAVGKLFTKGKYDVRRLVAVSGPMAIQPAYVSALPGTPMTALKAFYSTNADIVRVVSGDVLSGKTVGVEGYLGYFDNTVTLIKEGTEKEPFGWAMPLRLKQYSTDHTYFSWLTPWRKYDMDTNLHGGPRAFVMNDAYYAKVLPMDIYPLYLIKACLAGEIEKMEKFGIYEVLPEDLAVCEFVDPSKNYIQDIIAKGIDLMLKEMA